VSKLSFEMAPKLDLELALGREVAVPSLEQGDPAEAQRLFESLRVDDPRKIRGLRQFP
jgi:hypothetical protein